MRVAGHLAIAVTALALAGCGTRSSIVSVDGSSTVFPLTAIAAEDFQVQTPGIQVKVGASGTGGGFEKFCRGEIDANDASRPIKDEEAAACAATGIAFAPLTLAIDALTVVVNPANDWATCLTLAQLRSIWEPGSKVVNWRQVDPGYPDVPLRLFGPGTDSGTFDYFTKAINGEEGASRTDFTPTEDDNVIVQGVSGSKGGLGYFGYTYYEENTARLRAVSIDSGDGCVLPSAQSAQDGRYRPLSRPLFVYVSVEAMNRPEVRSFFDFYVANDRTIAEGARFIPLNDQQRAQLATDFARLAAAADSSKESGSAAPR
jgi:phosphate transport system substrate-binding protein